MEDYWTLRSEVPGKHEMFWVHNEDWMSLMGAVTTMQLLFLGGGSSVARQKKLSSLMETNSYSLKCQNDCALCSCE